MKLKRMIAVVLLVFVGASIAYMLVKEPDTSKPAEESASDETRESGQLVVYYFHGEVRCRTCHKLETYAKEALEANFGEELESKDIIWRTVNADRPENGHYVKKYELVTRAVVLSRVVDGKEIRWKNLNEIWGKVNNKQSYLDYVRKNIEEFLEAGA